MQKLKENSSGSEKNNSRFSDYLRGELHEKVSITQNDCHHTEYHLFVNCVATKFKCLSQDVYENCCPSIENNILIRGESIKWYNKEINIAKRSMRRTENKYMQDKTKQMT